MTREPGMISMIKSYLVETALSLANLSNFFEEKLPLVLMVDVVSY